MNERSVTLADVTTLAGEFDIAFTDNGRTFDLDTPEAATFQLHGTYVQTQEGLDLAYSQLVQYRRKVSFLQSRDSEESSEDRLPCGCTPGVDAYTCAKKSPFSLDGMPCICPCHDEPVLVDCPYCGGMHLKGTENICPLNPHRTQ